MTKEQVYNEFKKLYVNLNGVDYYTAQIAWTEYINSLQKMGYITETQMYNWTNPFHGKRFHVGK